MPERGVLGQEHFVSAKIKTSADFCRQNFTAVSKMFSTAKNHGAEGVDGWAWRR